MRLRLLSASSLLLATAALAGAQPSTHRAGPNGLDGWLVREVVGDLEDRGPLPTALVIARHGKVIRRLSLEHDGGPFYWNFVFLPGGREVAFERGSLHWNLTCTRMDIRTGAMLESYDCYRYPLPDSAPGWVKTLESTPKPDDGPHP